MITCILLLVTQGILLDKANDKWWKILIPFYGEYSMYKIARKKVLWFVKFIVSILAIAAFTVLLINFTNILIQIIDSYNVNTMENSEMINLFMESVSSNQVLIISFLLLSMLSLVSDVIRIVYYVGLSTSFGKPGIFAVGLFFLNVIFLAILAFMKDTKYVGNEELIEEAC